MTVSKIITLKEYPHLIGMRDPKFSERMIYNYDKTAVPPMRWIASSPLGTHHWWVWLFVISWVTKIDQLYKHLAGLKRRRAAFDRAVNAHVFTSPDLHSLSFEAWPTNSFAPRILNTHKSSTPRYFIAAIKLKYRLMCRIDYVLEGAIWHMLESYSSISR